MRRITAVLVIGVTLAGAMVLGGVRPSGADTTASITIELDSVPDNGRDVRFTGTGDGVEDVLLDDDDDPTLPSSVTFVGLGSGAYVFTQASSATWSLSSLDCGGSPAALFNQDDRRVWIALNGDDVHCRFENRRHRPDAWIAPPTGPFVGNNRYASTATTAQTRTARIPVRATRTFRVRLQNDGSLQDRFRVGGVASGAGGYAVRYFLGPLDVTNQVRNGTFALVSPLDPGQTFGTTLTIRITAGPSTRPGSTRTVVLTTRSVDAPRVTDVVRARVTRS